MKYVVVLSIVSAIASGEFTKPADAQFSIAAEVKIKQDQPSPVSEKIRELLSPDGTTNARHVALREFYERRQFAPIWTTSGRPTINAKNAEAFLASVASDGLNPDDYVIPRFENDDPSQIARDELAMSDLLIIFARDASIGRISPAKVSESFSYELEEPKPDDVLTKLSTSTDMRADLQSYFPQHAGYQALRRKLLELRNGREQKISHGPAIRMGQEDPRVPLLKKALGMGGDGAQFDHRLASAIKRFQKEQRLPVTGNVDQQTVARLNHRFSKVEGTIVANMERWRWLPKMLGTTHVTVNIADYSLKVVDHGQLVWTTRIIVGKPGNTATPLLSAPLQYLTINPTWNVPPSIVRNEFLPMLNADPGALERKGLRVQKKKDGSLQVYQPPGPRNALGRIRFNFPNEFSVYQHDTPNKDLFARNDRALSHGCMRVKDPEKYAIVLLSLSQPQEKFTEDRIRKMYGDEERTIRLKQHIPLHVTYQTAFVDENGKLQTRADVYGRDQALLSLLQATSDRVASRTKAKAQNI